MDGRNDRELKPIPKQLVGTDLTSVGTIGGRFPEEIPGETAITNFPKKGNIFLNFNF